jgi:ABC-type proline/glycine betaine transport system substrate-binding protein
VIVILILLLLCVVEMRRTVLRATMDDIEASVAGRAKDKETLNILMQLGLEVQVITQQTTTTTTTTMIAYDIRIRLQIWTHDSLR